MSFQNIVNKDRRRIKVLYGIISITTLSIGLLLSQFYRPFIYVNKINDFVFADTIGSLVSVVCYCFLIWSFKDYDNKQKNKQIIIATFIYSVFWEFLGFAGVYGTFDLKDICAGMISGLITFLLKEKIEKRVIV